MARTVILACLFAVTHLVGGTETPSAVENNLRGARPQEINLEFLPTGMPKVVPSNWEGKGDWKTPAIAFGLLFGIPIILIPLMIRMKATGDQPIRILIEDMFVTFFCIFATLPHKLIPLCKKEWAFEIPWDDYPATWKVHWETVLLKKTQRLGTKKCFDRNAKAIAVTADADVSKPQFPLYVLREEGVLEVPKESFDFPSKALAFGSTKELNVALNFKATKCFDRNGKAITLETRKSPSGIPNIVLGEKETKPSEDQFPLYVFHEEIMCLVPFK